MACGAERGAEREIEYLEAELEITDHNGDIYTRDLYEILEEDAARRRWEDEGGERGWHDDR
jgi:hypothetical protein